MSTNIIEEKENRLSELVDQINVAKNQLSDLYSQIGSVESEVFSFENANKMFSAMQISSIQASRSQSQASERNPQTTTSKLDDEHKEIITNRRNNNSMLKQQITALEGEQLTLTEKLDTLRDEAKAIQGEIIDISETIKLTNAENLRAHSESIYLLDQIRERENSIKQMKQLKNEADQYYSDLSIRENDFDSIDGGRLDTEKAILGLQDEIRESDSVISNLEEKITEIEKFLLEDKENVNNTKQQYSESVNWAQEKAELQEELKQLNAEIQNAKRCVTTSESRASKRNIASSKYTPILNKWKGKTGVMEIPNETITQLLAQLDEAKAQKEEQQKISQREIAEMVVSNHKLEDEVKRRRNALERIVNQFHADENELQKRIEEANKKSEAEEQKIVKQIEAAKIKIAARIIRKQ